MPKRNPNPGNPRPPQPPTSLPPGGPPPETKKLHLNLVNLNLPVLKELSHRAQVILQGGSPVRVFTPLGTRIGDVSKSGTEQLNGYRIIASTIYDLSLDPPSVVIEVLVL